MAMVTRPLVIVVICFGFFILLQSLVPKVMAGQKSSKVNEFMLQDQRIRRKRNYVLRLAEDSQVLRDNDNTGVDYIIEPLQSNANPEELSAFIVDYANMIRNDIVLLDNSVETRTRKRGNIKVKRYNQALPDAPCNCEYVRETLDFGENSYPRFVENRNCSKAVQNVCAPPYICKENIYNLTIISRRDPQRRALQKQESLDIPFDLRHKWIAEKRPISVGCTCARDYIIVN